MDISFATMNVLLSMLFLAIEVFTLASAQERSDLNRVLSFVVAEMNADGFLADLWYVFIVNNR